MGQGDRGGRRQWYWTHALWSPEILVAAGVERRDGLCRDLTDAFAPDEDVERAAAEIIQALRWTEPILRPDENRLVHDESKVTEAFALWIVLLVAAVVWTAL